MAMSGRFSAGVATGGNVVLSLILLAEPFLFVVASAFIMVTPAGAAFAASVPHLGHAATAAEDGVASSSCASNSTHCAWIDGDGKISFEGMGEARKNMTRYLWDNIMPYDQPIASTLGFDRRALEHDVPTTVDDVGGNHESVSRVLEERSAVDGLSNGIVNQTLFYSLKAKELYPWTDAIPRSVYLEYVVPYAVVNEPRTDHRTLLFDALKDTLKKYERKPDGQEKAQNPESQIKEVVKLINTRLWSLVGRTDKPIAFEAGQTPLIYDPLSVIAYGHSSCTGLAVLLVSALRSVGIPARMAGTPAWHGKPKEGNHSWVEVFVPNASGGRWIFLEPTPGIAEGDEEKVDADNLDRDPCKRWFCKGDRFGGRTKVYATRYSKDGAPAHYPMAWSTTDDKGVPGEDRSEFYNGICGQCK
ncbi:hypothetical protein ACHAWF_012884 [Thalassiosira exigua]